MVEIFGLVVSGVSLLLEVLSARREKVKGDGTAVRGLLALFHGLADWKYRAEATNASFAAWVTELLDADNDAKRRRLFASGGKRVRMVSRNQLASLEAMTKAGKRDIGVPAVVGLFQVYAPEFADAFERAFSDRRVLVKDLVRTAQDRYDRDGPEGLRDLVTEVERSFETLAATQEELREFIVKNIPIDQVNSRAEWLSWRIQHP